MHSILGIQHDLRDHRRVWHVIMSFEQGYIKVINDGVFLGLGVKLGVVTDKDCTFTTFGEGYEDLWLRLSSCLIYQDSVASLRAQQANTSTYTGSKYQPCFANGSLPFSVGT